jgi:hypothetical protein
LERYEETGDPEMLVACSYALTADASGRYLPELSGEEARVIRAYLQLVSESKEAGEARRDAARRRLAGW